MTKTTKYTEDDSYVNPTIFSNLKSTIRFLAKRNKAYHAWIQGKTSLDYAPHEIILEPTNHCNLHCRKCVHGSGMKRRKGYMDMDIYKAVLDKISPHAESLFFTGGGEPTLHPQIYEMIKLAKKAGIQRTLLLTNGNLLTENHFIGIIESNLDNLEFSIDGTDKETHEDFATGSKFDKVINNILDFLKYKKRVNSKRPFTSIKIIKYNPQQDNKISRKFYNRFKGLPLNRMHIMPLTYHSEYSRDMLEDEEFAGINRDHLINYDWDRYFPCLSIYQQIMVAWNGKIIACCGDLEGINEIGSLYDDKTTIADLWNSEKFCQLRKNLINKKLIPPCTICSQLWNTKPGSPFLNDLSFIHRIPAQIIRDFYPTISKFYYSVTILRHLRQ